MSNASRRSLPQASLVTPEGLAIGSGPVAGTPTSAQSRRRFLQATAGAAAGVVVVSAGPKLAAAALHGPSSTPLGAIAKPSGPPPAETVMAYIRDAARAEVTVTSGLRETTYRDPALVKRMIDAAR